MFGFKITIDDQTRKIRESADKGTFNNFFHAAASIRKDAISTIERAEGPSDPGSPPHTHRGTFLKRAILFAADKMGAVIGPAFSVVGESGHAHEFGGEYKGENYPARPFMAPALERAIPRFAGDWTGSIGE